MVFRVISNDLPMPDDPVLADMLSDEGFGNDPVLRKLACLTEELCGAAKTRPDIANSPQEAPPEPAVFLADSIRLARMAHDYYGEYFPGIPRPPEDVLLALAHRPLLTHWPEIKNDLPGPVQRILNDLNRIDAEQAEWNHESIPYASRFAFLIEKTMHTRALRIMTESQFPFGQNSVFQGLYNATAAVLKPSLTLTTELERSIAKDTQALDYIINHSGEPHGWFMDLGWQHDPADLNADVIHDAYSLSHCDALRPCIAIGFDYFLAQFKLPHRALHEMARTVLEPLQEYIDARGDQPLAQEILAYGLLYGCMNDPDWRERCRRDLDPMTFNCIDIFRKMVNGEIRSDQNDTSIATARELNDLFATINAGLINDMTRSLNMDGFPVVILRTDMEDLHDMVANMAGYGTASPAAGACLAASLHNAATFYETVRIKNPGLNLPELPALPDARLAEAGPANQPAGGTQRPDGP